MQIEITEAGYDCKVSLDGYYWLSKSSTYLFWWSDVVDPAEWFVNVYKPTQKNLPCLRLSLEKKFQILCFQATRN